jgi:outer membrane biosynthesis protein TonB
LTADLIITIGETGRVERAALARPVAPALDEDLVASALRWEYQPARRDGSPVKYAKTVRVEIR